MNFIYDEDIEDMGYLLEEEYQNIDLQFAFVKVIGEDAHQLTPFVLCRDFFNEYLTLQQVASLFPAEKPTYIAELYGFDSLSCGRFSIDDDIRLAIKYSDELSLEFINKYETGSYKKTTIELTNEYNIRILSFSKKILNNLVTLSYYTYIVRASAAIIKYNLNPSIMDYTKLVYSKNNIDPILYDEYKKTQTSFNTLYKKYRKALKVNFWKFTQNEIEAELKDITKQNELSVTLIHDHGGIKNAY